MGHLLKPYYTLDAVFSELKDLVSLNEAEDILLLAKDKIIDVMLRCDRPITLVSAEIAELVKIPYTVSDSPTEDLVATESVKEILKKEVTDAVWLVSDAEQFIHLDGSRQNIFLQPINCVPLGSPTSMRFEFKESRWLESNNPPIAGENLYAVEYDGKLYFVCKSMASNPFSDSSIRLRGEQRELNYRLDAFLVNELISKKKHVVKQEHLQAFIDSHRSSNEQVSHLSWADIFKPMKRYSEVFEAYKKGATKFINRENRLPTCKELWNEMKDIYGFDDLGKAIHNISHTPIDWVTFRTYFNRRVKNELKTRD